MIEKDHTAVGEMVEFVHEDTGGIFWAEVLEKTPAKMVIRREKDNVIITLDRRYRVATATKEINPWC